MVTLSPVAGLSLTFERRNEFRVSIAHAVLFGDFTLVPRHNNVARGDFLSVLFSL